MGLALAATGAASVSGARAKTAAASLQSTLSGTEFDLRIGDTPVNFTGTPRSAITVNGSLPAPVLRWREGTTVTLRVTNTLPVATSIHWHGILLPFQMDGVPGISFRGIEPGQTFVYRFPVKQSGTYWYHSHSGFQEQVGLYGPIIIDPAGADPIASEREHVVMLSDWTDEAPERVYENLKVASDYYNYQVPTVADFFRDASKMGVSAALARRKEWNRMRMNPTDLSDVSSATYTYLMNGTTPEGNWVGLARAGERVRLRFINSSASTIFDLRIPGLPLTVVAADGQAVQPVTVDELRISVAESYDVIVGLPDERAYTIFAQAIDRMGYARGTLAPQLGMAAIVPPLDPRTWLTMSDMGMGDMQGMDGMDGIATTSPAVASQAAASGADAGRTNGQDMQGMPGMAMPAGAPMPAASMPNHAMGSMPGSGPAASDAMKGMQDMPAASGAASGSMEMDTGPSVDNRAVSPGLSVIDPGPRLRDNRRRVLTYADLHTLGGLIDPRPPGRDIVLHLTGNMRRYIWGFDGKKYSEAQPIRLRFGERVRITLVNDTMMSHPIHLHGMWSEVEGPDGGFLVRKHTVNVHPGKRLSYRVTADARGEWAYHCHLLYHMEAGMFRKVVVE
jgi:CopA family copper-resistance protein